jgi:hypothetical protein
MECYITVTKGMRGYFAVMVERDASGFEEPVMSSPISCATIQEAVKDAASWARSEGLKCKF